MSANSIRLTDKVERYVITKHLMQVGTLIDPLTNHLLPLLPNYFQQLSPKTSDGVFNQNDYSCVQLAQARDS